MTERRSASSPTLYSNCPRRPITWATSHGRGQLARYQPTAGSPVLDAGIDLEARFSLDNGGQDFLGTKTPRGNPPDIGAIELRNGATNLYILDSIGE